MPRPSILCTAERETLLAYPTVEEDVNRYYLLSESDLSLIAQRRGDENRLGMAVQMCLLRFPGQGSASRCQRARVAD
jgi:TnpA family transposase